METSSEETQTSSRKKYRGVRRRRWGKWVSEIRVPNTKQRLWLGSFASAQAAGVAHDVAYYCLRRPSELEMEDFNFFPPLMPGSVFVGMSPRSIQRVASDAGMAIDARLASYRSPEINGTTEKESSKCVKNC